MRTRISFGTVFLVLLNGMVNNVTLNLLELVYSLGSEITLDIFQLLLMFLNELHLYNNIDYELPVLQR